MASSMIGQGYDERRFEGQVKPDLLCSICHAVLNNPKICQNKEHPFCLGCITQHLRNSPTCPECREHLTPETLKNAPRFLRNTLSELKISCDYKDRGCPDHVQLGNLQTHVDQCGFAPDRCGNEGCGMEVSRRDRENHEKNFCQFRILKCHDCRDIKTSQDKIKESVDQIRQTEAKMKTSQEEMKVQIAGVERKQDQIDAKVNQMTTNVDEIKQTQTEIKADQVALKAGISQQFEKMAGMMNQILQGSTNNNRAQAIDQAVAVHSVINQDIIILGGWYTPEDDKMLNTVETFNIVKGNSVQLPPMNHSRATSASCVYNNDVIVVGGYDDKSSDTIEILKMNQQPLQWRIFDGKLPAKLCAHSVIVYLDKLIVIGGYNISETKVSDAIYELRLTPLYASKLLVRMPQPRRNHGANLVFGKLYILGGITENGKDAVDSVFVYDFLTNECKPCASLPRAVCRMSTVTWGNMIIVIGGADNHDEALNDVIMYDTKSGRSEKLPSMKFNRRGCSAVIMDDVIVVFGGRNKEEVYLNSVERFTMGSDGWEELPLRMKEKRHCATAAVKPHN